MRTLPGRSRRDLLKRNRSEWEMGQEEHEMYGDWDNFEGHTPEPYGHSPEDNLAYPRSESRRMIGSGHTRGYENPDYNDQNFWHGDRFPPSQDWERYGPEENQMTRDTGEDEDERYPYSEYEYRYGRSQPYGRRLRPLNDDDYDTRELEMYSTPFARSETRRRLIDRRYEDLYAGSPEAMYYHSPYEEDRPHQRRKPSHGRYSGQGVRNPMPRDTAYDENYNFNRDAYPRHRPSIREKKY